MTRQLIVFDLGGVIVPRECTLRELTATFMRHAAPETDPFSFEQAYTRYRESYSLSMGPRDYFTALVRSAGVEPDQSLIQKLTAVDTRLSSTAGDAELGLLRYLQATDQPYAIFSNSPTPVMKAVLATAWGQAAAIAAFTPELRFTKPNQGAFREFERLAEAAGFGAGELVYFDDHVVNVDAATQRGWNAHLWESVEAAHEVLTPIVGIREVQ
ncbi:HAD family hydrolase [Corynebacterium heidelbergense]|uniref:HAD family phosphatase n=1 Tax=Corynebacterium heidelbergense TaxID=2055947 RepID=A0A364V9B5_9CORY|nr:HAD family hydrolase [Corynebacterium heidelbergense]RAV33252.1 hypothetical protein CWC39_09470 [Corynebacterium heidelbergense]WCZ37117.1 hypothetical protein CHEID_07930 [Corynebacterium heidelbergense]